MSGAAGSEIGEFFRLSVLFLRRLQKSGFKMALKRK